MPLPTDSSPRASSRRIAPGGKIALQIAADILLAGAVFLVYSLFHHVLPKKYTTSPTVDPTQIGDILPDEGGTSSAASDPASGSAQPVSREMIVQDEKRYNAGNFPGQVVTPLEGYGEEGDDLQIFLRKVEYGYGKNKVTYYAADIFVKSIDMFRTAVATKASGEVTTDTVDAMARHHDAVFAVSGDYFKNSEIGLVVRDGILYRDEPTPNDLCVLYTDGSMEVLDGASFPYDDPAALEGIWQAWSFGPNLLDEDGMPKRSDEEFNVNGSKKDSGSPFHDRTAMFSLHPRNLIGYVSPGHYIIVMIDGRDEGYSCGVNFVDEAMIAYEEGCEIAYNLDGGRSAMMVLENRIINRPYKDGRPISDIIYFTGDPQ